MKKNIKFILLFSLIFSFKSFANIEELPLIEDISSVILEENEPKKEVPRIKEENKATKKQNIEKIIDTKKNTSIKYDVDLEDIVDIYEKRVENNKAYRNDEEKPFSGIFGLVSLDKIQFYETFKDGLLDGETAWFNEAGVKMISEFYKAAKLDGEQKAYYSNGKLKSIVVYKNNKIESSVSYDKNGKEIFKTILKNGTGKWKFYWSNGKLFEEGNYVSYKKDGIWKRYREDGSLDTYFEYKNGRLIKERWE